MPDPDAPNKADTPRDGSAPCLIYGYGSYEASMDPGFSVMRLSLLDRGFVFAIAHVRGGGDLARVTVGSFLERRRPAFATRIHHRRGAGVCTHGG